MQEVWKDIDNYEGLYQISNLGRIKSLNYNHTGKEKNRRIDRSNKGYLTILLCNNGKKKKYNIHRLVAESFLENPYNLSQINHKDGNKNNNCVDNLEWCNNSYNEKHAYKLGLKPKLFGNKNPRAKSVLQYDLNKNLLNEFQTIEEAHKKTNIATSTIIKSCKGKTKRHYKFIFEYKEAKDEDRR